jgi:hypothetical protein
VSPSGTHASPATGTNGTGTRTGATPSQLMGHGKSRPMSAAPSHRPLSRPVSPMSDQLYADKGRRASLSPWQPSPKDLEKARLKEASKQSRRYAGSPNPIPLRRVSLPSPLGMR